MKHLALLCLAALAGPALAAAQVVDIVWTPEGRFEHKATLAPRQLLEVCGKLAPGGAVSWSFESSAALPFNIHVHEGKEVIYPARLERAERAQGLQTFQAEPAHCWMWTNTSPAPVQVGAELLLQR